MVFPAQHANIFYQEFYIQDFWNVTQNKPRLPVALYLQQIIVIKMVVLE